MSKGVQQRIGDALATHYPVPHGGKIFCADTKACGWSGAPGAWFDHVAAAIMLEAGIQRGVASA